MTIKTRAITKTPIKSGKSSNSTKPGIKKFPVKSKIVEGVDIISNVTKTGSDQSVDVSGTDHSISGRGVFAVRTLGGAVSVEAAFLAQDGNVLRLPAVFPNREYALQQIDELREIVIRHFNELSGQGGN